MSRAKKRNLLYTVTLVRPGMLELARAYDGTHRLPDGCSVGDVFVQEDVYADNGEEAKEKARLAYPEHFPWDAELLT